ncbi:hypothetical protein SARC_01451 [Sphaeroforma arctica JP610]|uniref:DNA primase n=1 Tax=Sphaeroforma arctica JP610 TaxID=667725 RepID=A0A0L0GBY0_9EUKA|nr:hypothetical protein SARC_01451 [Sphaeroforma arctica JP610]KNC86401.1 hypothetical protein SARC_01451 [Sphaeroforma arctica JP610]|eukprot:XP_014160303.1 hypothetical protein SARC_01451 [Sphaeroforma arctica JP610]
MADKENMASVGNSGVPLETPSQECTINTGPMEVDSEVPENQPVSDATDNSDVKEGSASLAAADNNTKQENHRDTTEVPSIKKESAADATIVDDSSSEKNSASDVVGANKDGGDNQKSDTQTRSAEGKEPVSTVECKTEEQRDETSMDVDSDEVDDSTKPNASQPSNTNGEIKNEPLPPPTPTNTSTGTAKSTPAPTPTPAKQSNAFSANTPRTSTGNVSASRTIKSEIGSHKKVEATRKASAATPTPMKRKQEGGELAEFEALLKQYYSRFFPYKDYYKWLAYGDLSTGRYLGQREFSFTLKDDIYIRYQSFDSMKDLMLAVQSRNPYKIDIGAVYNAKPKDHKTVKSGHFKPSEKELVFDIDMTDYDDIRTCCSGAAICPLCWPFMSAAIAVMDVALEEDFGFKHKLWIYSGRRGVHCWVCDKEARNMDNEERGAVTEYLTVIKGGDKQAQKVKITNPPHPSLSRALNVLSRYFKKVALKNQKLLQYIDTAKAILALVADESIRSELLAAWKEEGMFGCGLDQPDENPPTDTSDSTYPAYSGTVSLERWKQLEARIEFAIAKNPRNYQLKTSRDEIILQHIYPRLDVNVSKGINHLLKSPFCVHPKTGRVCVPIDVNNLDTFNPFKVPTISDLIRDLDEWHANNVGAEDPMDEDVDDFIKQEAGAASFSSSNNKEGRVPTDFQKTSLMRYMVPFQRFLKGMSKELSKEREARQVAEAQSGQY